LKSYFFIPANKKQFLSKADTINATEIVIDLEDAIFNSDVSVAVDNIISLKINPESWIRISYVSSKSLAQFEYLDRLTKKGFKKYIIPKVSNIEEFRDVLTYYSSENLNLNEFKFIVLVENPEAVLNISAILKVDQVEGVGIGSHDYCDIIGMEHSLENLYWVRMKLLNIAKAMGKRIIDIASMNIENKSEFRQECEDGLKKGFDGKFIIHPWQLKIFNSIKQYSKEEVEFAKLVRSYINKIGGRKKFTITKINGKVVEKPHLKRFNEILSSTGHETF